jgi:uncharacterized tellurite resistance protein B-like protein
MIDLVKKFFSRPEDSNSGHTPEGTPHDIRIATCALLLEMASIDGEFDETEKDHIISILKNNYDLSDEVANALLEQSNKKLEQSIDLWRFAQLINHKYSQAEKIQVIEMVWRIAYADGSLDKHEDYLVHKMANLLRLSHKQLIDAKLKVKEEMME